MADRVTGVKVEDHGALRGSRVNALGFRVT